MSEPNNKEINVTSGVSVFTGEPFIHIQWGEMHGQLTPEAARQHAFYILECTEAALSDAFLWKFLRENVKTDEEGAARALMHFRKFRGERDDAPDIPEGEQ